METISINLNRELAIKAKPMLSHYGIDIETALNNYLTQIILGIDSLSQENKSTKYVRPPFQFGSLKGILDIDDDFNDVLVDFEEYM
jgi:hypothetical protein